MRDRRRRGRPRDGDVEAHRYFSSRARMLSKTEPVTKKTGFCPVWPLVWINDVCAILFGFMARAHGRRRPAKLVYVDPLSSAYLHRSDATPRAAFSNDNS
jgi:hypothetical protein